MKKKITIGSLILIVIIGAVLGFALFNHNKNHSLKYKTESVDKGDIESLVVTTGTLNPVIIVDVGSQVSGKIEKLYVDFNSEVKEGQLIAKIEQSSFLIQIQQNEANYQSALAALEKANVTLKNNKNQYERSLELFKKDLISYEEKESVETEYFSANADVQSAEAKLEQARSQLETSKVDLAYTLIKSPIDGIVINREVNIGQTVAASFQAPVLFQIANDLSKMQVECSVDEADIGKVKEGQKVNFTVDAFPEEKFTGKVSQVRYSAEVIQNVVTYTTVVEVDNPEMKLRPGMTATVSVIVGEARNTLRIPNAALRFTPQLIPKEMRRLFEEMDKDRQEESARAVQADEQTTDRQKQEIGSQFAGLMVIGIESTRIEDAGKKDLSLVWTIDEKGELKPIFIETGITDNSYTEFVWGNLKEGQQLITGLWSEKESSKNTDSKRGMMMMGPPPGG